MLSGFTRGFSAICLFMIGFTISCHSAQAVVCEVDDVVAMVEDGLDRTAIRSECSGKVDAGDCSLTRVIRMAEDGDFAEDIIDACISRRSKSPDGQQNFNRSTASFCVTPYGSCPLMVAMPPDQSCYCTGFAGTAWGVSQ